MSCSTQAGRYINQCIIIIIKFFHYQLILINFPAYLVEGTVPSDLRAITVDSGIRGWIHQDFDTGVPEP